MTEEARKFRQVPWIRIGAEAVAVIASILIAFSLDAWWDGLQASPREQQYLVGLEQDFQANQSDLRRTIQIQDTVLQSIQELVRFGATTLPSPDADTVKRLIMRVFTDINVRFTPTIGTYQELRNTSNLHVLTNDSLRILLSDLDGAVRRVSRVEEGADDSWSRSVTEHLVTRLDLVGLLPKEMLGPDRELQLRPAGIDLSGLPRDRVFSNIMVGRLAATVVRLSMYRDLEVKTGEILSVLERDLAH
ncbi:MAG: DUF6090 family protein [Gemmatimonadota bacterium]|jgi:hypothetical protein